MKKQVKKWLTLTMAFALILGSISYNPLAANATAVSTVGTENSVTGNDADGIVSDDVGSNRGYRYGLRGHGICA